MSATVAAIGAGIGLASSIYGGVKAGQERRKMDSYLTGQESENEAWYNKNYYGNYLDRTDVQALQKNLRDKLKKDREVTEQTAVISGATPEAKLAQKEQSNKVLTDTSSNIAAMGQQWKDNIQRTYMGRKDRLSGMRYGEMEQNAQSFENLMGSGIKQIGNAATGFASESMTPDVPDTVIPEKMGAPKSVVDSVRDGLYNSKTTK